MKKALVTGASRGIGRAIAEELGRDHHVYVGASRDASEVVATLPSAEPFVVDLRDSAAVAQACAGIGELDVLVHAAGIYPKAPFDELTDEQWREAFEVNVFAGVTLVRELLPALRRSRGLILTINSGAGFHGVEGGSVYCATKFALKGLTDTLRLEEQGRVRVTSLHPGPTDTDMLAGDPRPKMSPAAVAQAARLAVDVGPEAVIDFLRVSPLRKS
ncbi:SDR family oxidoreductase [Corynebacterium liangguodongii]|uniref:Short chain dehydrogenase n=1 Tax=Corynebacterium liangguodongii TaxID=2079535 RepID=A0A2S0WCU2_9CORY|nr:SDR family oxidoreductase [Corynebacterium liangguodongii]AWB83597.1 short chain dehydrogenase [Corynebacterium liangguodongii]PWB98611.1 short chain dehydrogenase [Corynebacterium liangguodongii]